ncbi:hypothetical protein KIW84_056971 [Lathyrus oleraceus]|uniref:Uncharacterized protein n=1 Tax=Pisum sativum TaxID=3888 RepID=A0A9D4WZR6_PEA|nr:hypothetical protein KIW84_056971 [Pisum sativum]
MPSQTPVQIPVPIPSQVPFQIFVKTEDHIVFHVPAMFPFESTKHVPWNYNSTTYVGDKPIVLELTVTNIARIRGMTRSGILFYPEPQLKEKMPESSKEKEVESSRKIIPQGEAEEFLRTIHATKIGSQGKKFSDTQCFLFFVVKELQCHVIHRVLFCILVHHFMTKSAFLCAQFSFLMLSVKVSHAHQFQHSSNFIDSNDKGSCQTYDEHACLTLHIHDCSQWNLYVKVRFSLSL